MTAQVRQPYGQRIHRGGHERGREDLVGVVGMIIAQIRMTTVFHDSCGPAESIVAVLVRRRSARPRGVHHEIEQADILSSARGVAPSESDEQQHQPGKGDGDEFDEDVLSGTAPGNGERSDERVHRQTVRPQSGADGAQTASRWTCSERSASGRRLEAAPPCVLSTASRAGRRSTGLYMCGAATHPGGSVIGLNGRNAAMAAIEDLG